ncbi:MAG: hypothetical protein HY678_00815 [Chloroflexi bacterium]|nr:hypothetical protein [Chloroflexota bacterium]
MVEDRIAQIANVVRESSHDLPGYRSMLTKVGNIVEKLEEETADVLAQRDKARNLYQQLRYQAETFFSAQDLIGLPQPQLKYMSAADDESRLRNEVLRVAGTLPGDEITVAHVTEMAAMSGLHLPWKNPNAVVATLLSRSSLWERLPSGKYRRKKAVTE